MYCANMLTSTNPNSLHFHYLICPLEFWTWLRKKILNKFFTYDSNFNGCALKNVSFFLLHFPLVNISYIFMGENLNSIYLTKKKKGDFFNGCASSEFFLLGQRGGGNVRQ